MKFGSLFSGIGGMDLGLERVGMECRWQVEIDEFCRKVLTKHWPNVPKFNDVKEVGKHNLESVDLIAGGFPCQDISEAGKRAGIEGEQSGLWSEYHRIIREIRPRFVLVENVSELLVRGIGRVLGDLAQSGYDAEWQCLPAGAFGAVHCRDRVFVLAFDTHRNYDGEIGASAEQRQETSARRSVLREGSHLLPFRNSRRSGWRQHWEDEPAVGRVADGTPHRVDRLRGLGNAVVPQVAQWVGGRILEAEQLTHKDRASRRFNNDGKAEVLASSP